MIILIIRFRMAQLHELHSMHTCNALKRGETLSHTVERFPIDFARCYLGSVCECSGVLSIMVSDLVVAIEIIIRPTWYQLAACM